MTIDSLGLYKGIGLSFSFADGAIKLLVGLMLFIIILYSFLLILKVRVLMDTVNISESKITKMIITVNVLASALGAVLAFILILL